MGCVGAWAAAKGQTEGGKRREISSTSDPIVVDVSYESLQLKGEGRIGYYYLT